MGTWEDAGLIQVDNQAKWNAAQLTTGQLLNKKQGKFSNVDTALNMICGL